MLPNTFINVILFIMAWMFRSKWFKIKVHINIKVVILQAYQQVIMSYQNNIAKESLSLQNHIVRPCFIFITQNTPIMHNPGFSQAIGSYFLTRFSFFQLSCNTWAWAMDIALWVEYNMMMEVVWRRQKRKKVSC